MHVLGNFILLLLLLQVYGFQLSYRGPSQLIQLKAKITPTDDFENMDEYRKAVMNAIKEQAIDRTKLGNFMNQV